MREFGDAVLLGDSAYKLSPYMMTPLTNPVSPEEAAYNESQIRTRNAVERTFGVWKRRFPIIGLGTQLKVQNVQRIVVATAILHNILIELGDDEPPPDPDIDADWDSDDDADDVVTPSSSSSALAARRQALAVQRKFVLYFRRYC